MKNSQLALLGGRPILKKPYSVYNDLGREEEKAALQVMRGRVISDFLGRAGAKFLGGKYVKNFEAKLVERFKVKYAVSFNSATTALQGAVGALGVGPGDEVITTPYTMTASASAILLNNALPVFADIDPKTFCLDPEDVKKKITRRTKAILTVNLFGGSCDYGRLKPLAKKHRLPIIEDNAQAIGGKYHGRYLGTIGDLGVLSFNVHKTLQSGEGGVILTNNSRYAYRAQLIRNHGEAVIDDLFPQEDFEPLIGSNYRLTEMQAAIGLEQLKKIERLNKPRVDLANYLTKALKQFSWLEPPYVLPNSRHVCYVYAFKFLARRAGFSRAIFAQAMAKEGFNLNQGYTKPLYLMPVYQKKRLYPRTQFPFISQDYKNKVDYRPGLCPIAEKMYSEELLFTVICNRQRSRADLDLFISAIEKIQTHKQELIAYDKKNKK